VFSEDEQSFSITHYYPDPPAELSTLASGPQSLAAIPWLVIPILAKREVLPYRDPDRRDTESGSERPENDRLACFPLVCDGRVAGWVSFTAKLRWEPSEVDALRVVSSLVAIAFGRVREGHLLGEHIRFSKLVEDVSRRFVALNASDVPHGIEEALRAVVETYDLTRAIVLRLGTTPEEFTLVHRYPNEGQGLFSFEASIPASRMPYVVNELLAGNEVHYDGVHAG
jgi:hypothetical protein